jgi:heterodisulfide reductase subunit D
MKLTTFFQGIRDESLVCARCGYCRVDCPTYKVIGWESASPRGRIKIARDIAEHGIQNPKEVERIFECTLCGRCREVCTTDIDLLEVWKELRAEIAGDGRQPESLKVLVKNIDTVGNITGEPAEQREMWLGRLDESFKDYIGKKGEVLYFTGCTGALFPAANKIPQSFVEILKEAKVNFTLLGKDENCCGFPLYGAGEFAKGKEMILSNIAKIQELGVKEVVTTCPSCYHTIKEDWVKVYGKELPFTVAHVSQYLERLIKEGKLEFEELNERVTYHDPCDLGRNSGIYEAPRNVIKSIPGVELIEMHKNRENANCCGGGGNLEAVEPELVGQISVNRLNDAKEIGVSTIISSCQQCKRTLHSAAVKNKIRIRTLDLTEFVLKALRKSSSNTDRRLA